MTRVITAASILFCFTSLSSAQIIFEDSFDDGNYDGWSIIHPGSDDAVFEVVDGELRMAHSEGSPAVFQAVALDISSVDGVDNGIFSFDLTLETPNTFAGAPIRVHHESISGYSFGLGRGPTGTNSGGLFRFDNGVPAELPTAVFPDDIWTLGETYRMSVSFDGPNFDISATDKNTGESWSASGVDGVYSTGRIELLIANSAFSPLGPVAARFDNVVLEAVPEPSTSVLGMTAFGVLMLRRRRTRIY